MPKYVRVRDTTTGHQFDIQPRSMRRGVEPLNDPERWPDLDSPGARPRPPKHYVDKAGAPSAPVGTPTTEPAGDDLARTAEE